MLKSLKSGSVIAFKSDINSNFQEIQVSEITSVCEDGSFICHFLMGFRSESSIVKPEDVLAIGDLENGGDKLNGWSGKYHFIQPEKLMKLKIIF